MENLSFIRLKEAYDPDTDILGDMVCNHHYPFVSEEMPNTRGFIDLGAAVPAGTMGIILYKTFDSLPDKDYYVCAFPLKAPIVDDGVNAPIVFTLAHLLLEEHQFDVIEDKNAPPFIPFILRELLREENLRDE